MDIIVIRDGQPTIEKRDSLTMDDLRSIIGAERLEVVMLDSPVEEQTLAAYFDEAGARKHRPQNIIIPGAGDIRGPVVICGLDGQDRIRGLLPDELLAYDLEPIETHFLRALRRIT